ncbi:MAG TPA: hypothetical protein VG273_24975 [Bryobacteraceae bacterium]|jgi:hypothetical protein|nr:hypothetical protein [Bryobacteraceae bacterium]
MRLFFAILLTSFTALAQTPAAPESAATGQQILDIFNGMSRHAARVEPMLRQLKPAEWVAKGAPDAYVAQLNSALIEVEGIQTDMSALIQHPDRMSDAMKALFRVEAAHRLLGSLMGGVRRYQNPALAELIESVDAEDHGDVERLQQYLLELAGAKEQQFEVVDREAQRCRGMLLRQLAEPSRPVRKTQ